MEEPEEEAESYLCEACGGSGFSDEYSEEEGAEDCQECGGDGYIYDLE